jgi:hypothetical protein
LLCFATNQCRVRVQFPDLKTKNSLTCCLVRIANLRGCHRCVWSNDGIVICSENVCSCVHLSTMNLILSLPETNLSHRDKKPESNCLSYGTASSSTGRPNVVRSESKEKKLRGFSPQANYIDRETAACRRSWCQLQWTEGVAWSAQRIPTADNFGLLDRRRYFSIQVAPQLSSRGWVGPVPDPLFLRKSVAPGTEPETSGSVARNS